MSIRSDIEGDPRQSLKILSEYVEKNPHVKHHLDQEAIDLLVEWLEKESEE